MLEYKVCGLCENWKASQLQQLMLAYLKANFCEEFREIFFPELEYEENSVGKWWNYTL